jgi:hypothetical protein
MERERSPWSSHKTLEEGTTRMSDIQLHPQIYDNYLLGDSRSNEEDLHQASIENLNQVSMDQESECVT